MKKTIVFLAMLCAYTSCTNLDLNPLSEGASETWYSNEIEFELAVNHLYHWSFWDLNPAQEIFRNQGWRDAWTDDWTNRNIVSSFANGTVNPQTDYVVLYWNQYYTAIAA